jgi:phage recombination protein Bet
MSETALSVQQAQVTADEVRKFIVGQKTFERVPKNQIDMAIETARAYNLNPFKREVHFTAYNGEIKIIVGYEVYLKRAEATKKLNGWKVEIVGQGTDMKAVVTIYRKDWEFPFVHEAYKVEVAQNTPIWQKMPRFMLKKVAIGQAFRLAFPEEMGGMPYMEEELPDMGGHATSAHNAPLVGQVEDSTSDTPPSVETSAPSQLDTDTQSVTSEPVEDVTPTCEECHKVITAKVAEYSKDRFGKALCMTHQKGAAA